MIDLKRHREIPDFSEPDIVLCDIGMLLACGSA